MHICFCFLNSPCCEEETLTGAISTLAVVLKSTVAVVLESTVVVVLMLVSTVTVE